MYTVSEQCVGNVLIIFFFIFNVYILLMGHSTAWA